MFKLEKVFFSNGDGSLIYYDKEASIKFDVYFSPRKKYKFEINASKEYSKEELKEEFKEYIYTFYEAVGFINI